MKSSDIMLDRALLMFIIALVATEKWMSAVFTIAAFICVVMSIANSWVEKSREARHD